MSEAAQEILPVNIEDELKKSYLDYAMSVIVGRALPDVRDGLKPVHRRILFAMHELKNDWNKPYKKSARIVGDVVGKYHPHGDSAVYDAIVRMAQDFSLRYMLVDGQGNFGSVDGDPPAAMRYTEIRMSKLAHALLADLDKETVDFHLNYDETEQIPEVLPSRVPNLLVNGSAGIAVGMATNIPPHNLGEVIDACIALIDNPNAGLDTLMQHIPGPDFPTSGIINGTAGIISAYKTGRGRIMVRARAHIETAEKGGKQSIIVTELPYMVNKARLIEKIAEMVKLKKIEGISALRDESDKDGMRMVIEVRKGDNAEVLLNNLYSQTQLQNVFGMNLVALKGGQPQVMSLRAILDAFIEHRREVTTRRTLFDLNKARNRAHILEGLGIALVNIDEMIALIKASKNPEEARKGLLAKEWQTGMVAEMLARSGADSSRPEHISPDFGLTEQGYRLSPEQAQAILDLRLHRLTGLEQDKIMKEYQDVLQVIQGLLEILESPERLMQVIRDDMLDVRQSFSDARRTEIIINEQELQTEDLIDEEEMVVTLSHQGYVKAQPLALYQAQRRGGRGKAATKVKDEDFVQRLVVANSHDMVLCFSSAGKVYWLKVYQLPQAGRTSRGRPIVNLLPLQANERINAMLPVKEFSEDHFVFMATAKGTVKKVSLDQFSRPRANGIIAIELQEDDQLIGVRLTHGEDDVMLFTNAGKAIRFSEQDVRGMGRTARGVRGVKLQADQRVISIIRPEQEGAVLTATENGYGKRTLLSEYRLCGRGGQGVISIVTNERNGHVVGAITVNPEDEVMLITDRGTLVRTTAEGISQVGRNAQGVRLINLTNGEKLVGIVRIADIQSDIDADNTES